MFLTLADLRGKLRKGGVGPKKAKGKISSRKAGYVLGKYAELWFLYLAVFYEVLYLVINFLGYYVHEALQKLIGYISLYLTLYFAVELSISCIDSARLALARHKNSFTSSGVRVHVVLHLGVIALGTYLLLA